MTVPVEEMRIESRVAAHHPGRKKLGRIAVNLTLHPDTVAEIHRRAEEQLTTYGAIVDQAIRATRLSVK